MQPIAPGTLLDATVGVAYSQTLTALNATTWSIADGELPAGFTLTGEGASATLAGTPEAAGQFSFTVRAENGTGSSATQPYTLTIRLAGAPLQILPPQLGTAVENTAFTATLTGTGGTESGYAWRVSAGALPPGLTLAASGAPSTTLSGTPTTAGSNTFTVELKDSAGATATLELTLVVRARPSITTTSVPDGVVADAYEATLTATGGTGAGYTWLVVRGTLPPGLYLGVIGTPSTTISGLPFATGNYEFTVQVTDGAGVSAEADFSILITTTLAITSIAIPQPIEAVPYSAVIRSNGGAGGAISWTISDGTVPAGLALSGTGATAMLTGTPSVSGPYSFTVQATDSSGTDEQLFSGIIGPRLEVAPLTPSQGSVQAAYAQPVTATGGVGTGYQWSVSAGALPPGLSLGNVMAKTALIAGTPTMAGTFDFTLRVEDASGVAGTRDLSIVINPQLEILAATLPDGLTGSMYTTDITATGGSGGYSWTLAMGVLPPGLTLAPMGTPSTTLSGSPTVASTFFFTLRVTDVQGATATRQFQLTVEQTLFITTMTVPRAVQGLAYTATLAALGGSESGYTWSITSGSLPAGLTLGVTGTPSTTISGTPTVTGNFPITVQLMDDDGETTDRMLTVEVAPALQITTTTLAPMTVGTPYSQVVASTGGSGTGQSWVLVSGMLPPGITGIAQPSPTRQLALFDYTGVSGSTSPVSATTTDPQVQSPVQIFKVNLGSSGNTGEYGASSWTAGTSFDASMYYSVRISPLSGGLLNLTRFETRARTSSTTTGATALHVRANHDSFGSDLLVIPLTTSHVLHGIDLPAQPFSNLTGQTEFRIYASGATTTSSTLWTYLDDTRIVGNNAVPATGASVTLTGAPTTAGMYTFTVRVTDSTGASDEETYMVTVSP